MGKLLILGVANAYIAIVEGGKGGIFGAWRLRKHFNICNFEYIYIILVRQWKDMV